MASISEIVVANLTAPMVLFFVLGWAAGMARSDLTVPEQLAKGLSLYLMLAIGFKGGIALVEAGFSTALVVALLLGIVLSFGLPFLAFAGLRAFTRLDRVDAAAVAAHYGSISVVTFIAASSFLHLAEVPFSGYMVAVMASMETPAILSGLLLARRQRDEADMGSDFIREVFLNGSVVLLLGAFVIGAVSGPAGDAMVSDFIRAPFKGALCIFLLDMGLTAARRLRTARNISPTVGLFAVLMPPVAGTMGALMAAGLGFAVGDVTMFAVLAGSASYIAVPAALRLALPEANPAISLTASLGLTFPFNLAVGIPLYYALANLLTGS